MRTEALPRRVLTALARLEDAGYPAYLVGGCVRDLLRGETPHDFDITTLARPEQTEAVFSDCKLIRTGLKHGTLTVLSEGLPLEITTYRTDGSYSDGRHPDFVRFGTDLREDLMRRDFTVNAMAWSPVRGLQDPFDGQGDLQKKQIRAVGNPAKRFGEDALRILRGARFASCLGFDVEAETASAMQEQIPLLGRVSAERIASEFTRLLCGQAVEPVLMRFRDLFAFFLPELRPCFGFDQKTPYHCYDLYTHSVKVTASVYPDKTLRLAAFFHDIGKPDTFVLRNGRGHFKGHPARSAEICETVLHRLHMEKARVRDVCTLIREHDFVLDGGEPIELLRQLPAHLIEPLFALMRADARAKADPSVSLDQIQAFREELNALREKPLCLSVRDLAVNGDDLLSLGVPNGKPVGDALRALLERVQDGSLPNERNALLQAIEKKIK